MSEIQWNYVYKGQLLLVQYKQLTNDVFTQQFTQKTSDWLDGTDKIEFGGMYKYIAIAGFRIKKVNKEFLKNLNFKPKK